MFSSDIIAFIKDSVDILEIIGQVVRLKRAGRRYVGLCPFHNEKTPSFYVSPEEGFFYCFGCGEGGDVIKFVMRHWNLSFMEAVQFLAERYRIQLPADARYVPKEPDRHKDLYEVLEAACEYFYAQLHHSGIGKTAREYLRGRGLTEAIIEQQRLGYAPKGWNNMLRYLNRRGIDEEIGVKAGLLIESEQGRIYDRFRDRLIFPITDPKGRIVAFGGRSLDGSEPKYLNSPETPIYNKGKTLYGYPLARKACKDKGELVVVEGYMDLLALYARGFYRAVATLGTALTAAQVRLMRRIADEVIMVYDADEAGQKAMFRALPLFLEEQLAVSCIHLPDGMDPDDFLNAHNIEDFLRLLEERHDLGRYVLEKKLEYWDGTIAGKTALMEEIGLLLQYARNPVIYMDYLRLVCERLKVSETLVDRYVKRHRSLRRKRGSEKYQVSKGDFPGFLISSPEETIIRVLIHYPELIQELKEQEFVDYFESPALKSIIQVLLSLRNVGSGSEHTIDAYNLLPDQQSKNIFARLSLDNNVPDDLKTARIMVKDRLESLKKRAVRNRLKQLQAALVEAERDGDRLKVKEVADEIQALHRMTNACARIRP